jgi:hypothetical protein
MDLREVGRGSYPLDLADSGCREVAGTCECGNEPSGSIKCGELRYASIVSTLICC